MRWVPVLMTVCLAASAGCAPMVGVKVAPSVRSEASAAPKRSDPSQAPSPSPVVVKTLVTGQVMAPAGVVGVADASLIGQDGNSLVAEHGTGVVAAGTGAFRTAALEEAPLAGAEVYLGDAASNPIPDLPHAVTDAKGQYRLTGTAPAGTYTVIVKMREGSKSGVLETLIKPGDAGVTANVSAASTCVSVAVLNGSGDALGTFNPATFQAAVTGTAARLESESLPDLTARQAVLDFMTRLAKEVAELKGLLGEITQQLGTLNDKIDKITERLDASPSPRASDENEEDPEGPCPSARVGGPAPMTLTLHAELNGPPGTGPMTVYLEGEVCDEDYGVNNVNPKARVTLGESFDLAVEVHEFPAYYYVYIAPTEGFDISNQSNYAGYFDIALNADGTLEIDQDWDGYTGLSLKNATIVKQASGSPSP